MAGELNLIAFIRSHVHSIWALELLLLLHSDPKHLWTISDIVRELRATNQLVRVNLSFFEQKGLVAQQDSHWRYSVPQPMHEIVRSLAQTYRERPSWTIEMIFRDDPVQSLADAFRIRGHDT